jgi:hypothetical protein
VVQQQTLHFSVFALKSVVQQQTLQFSVIALKSVVQQQTLLTCLNNALHTQPSSRTF